MIKGVPESPVRLAFNAFVAAIRGAKALANNRVVKTWNLWDGEKDPVDATTDNLPMVTFRMTGGPVRRIANARAPGQPIRTIDEAEVTILVDLSTAGTDQNDVSDLAALIHAALSPADPAERAALNSRFREVGIADFQMTRTILPASGDSFALEGVNGQGSYLLKIHSFS